MSEQDCPTCGPTTVEQHPRQPVTRCANCKEWLTSVPPTHPPAAPETDANALREALAKHLHERFAPDWAPHWDDLDETEQADSIHADMARSLLEPDGALTALLADLDAARERVRVVEGERDAALAELSGEVKWRARLASERGDFLLRAESAEAAHRALQAAVEALADLGVRENWPPDEFRAALRALAGGAR